MKSFHVFRIDSGRNGISAPFVGDYDGETALQAVAACLENQTWIAGTEPFADAGTEITRLNVGAWKKTNRDLGYDATYNQMVHPGDRLYEVEGYTLIVQEVQPERVYATATA